MDLVQKLKQTYKKNRKKLTLFDIVVLGLMLVLFISFIFVFRRTTPRTTIWVKVTDQDVLYAYTHPQSWYANVFQVGDTEVNALGAPIAKITNVERFVTDEVRKAVYLELNIKATYDTRNKRYTYKGKPLIFGTPLRFNMGKVYFDSIVVSLPDEVIDHKRIKLTIEAEMKNIPNYQAEAIQQFEGRSVLDKQGITYVTVNKISKVISKTNYKIIDSNNLTFRKDDEYSDLFMELIVYAKETPSEYFAYRDIPLKIGLSIPISFPEMTFHPIVTKFLTAPQQ